MMDDVAAAIDQTRPGAFDRVNGRVDDARITTLRKIRHYFK
jgi:hypothetical protein